MYSATGPPHCKFSVRDRSTVNQQWGPPAKEIRKKWTLQWVYSGFTMATLYIYNVHIVKL